MIPFERYDIKENTLLTCVSYEERTVISLDRVLQRGNINKCILIKLTDLNLYNNKWKSLLFPDNDARLKGLWEINYKLMVELLEKWNVEKIEVSELSFRAYHLSKEINKYTRTNEDVLFDLSCLPKNVLLSILRWCDAKFTFLYTRPAIQKEAETEFSIGVREFGIIRGYEGNIRLSRQTFLVIILGFEGARALSIFRHFEPYKVLALIGNPASFLDHEKVQFYLDNARNNNIQLLSNQRVIFSEVPSLDPCAFADALEEKISECVKDEVNILISPLGTKPQVLGLFLYWLKHKDIQIVYSFPSKRGLSSEGGGQAWIYRIEEKTV
jgi:hypothetical protein